MAAEGVRPQAQTFPDPTPVAEPLTEGVKHQPRPPRAPEAPRRRRRFGGMWCGVGGVVVNDLRTAGLNPA